MLGENEPVNALMYADDIILLANSEAELQQKLNALNIFCKNNKLQINTKKTKCMVFNRGNRLCKATLKVDNNLIENVKEFKYLGFTVGAKNCSFGGTIKDLCTKTKRAIFSLNSKTKLTFLPIKISLKILFTQLVPILLYGSEVWGPYSNFNFSNWEKSETEKTFTQYLKRVLGCDIRTANLMTRTELGTRPLLCDILRRSVSFLNHVKSNPESLANQALIYERTLDDEGNVLQLVRTCTPFNQENWEPFDKNKVKKKCHDYYDDIAKLGISNLSKSESFRLYKENIEFSEYLNVVKNNKHRKSLSRLRLSCHPLMIEKGRHQKPLLDRSKRICPLCKEVIEDEIHFITECPLYEVERTNLYIECLYSSEAFQLMTNKERFIFIMSSENSKILQKLANFVYKGFKAREKLLSV